MSADPIPIESFDEWNLDAFDRDVVVYGVGHRYRWKDRRRYRITARETGSYTREFVAVQVWPKIRKEGWMRTMLRRATLFMSCAALVALAVAVGLGGKNAVVIAQTLAAGEILIVAAVVFYVACNPSPRRPQRSN